MQRTGRINMPSFRIVVTEHTASPKAGRFVDKVGTYNPKTKERTLDEAKVKHWMSVGAKPSATVHNMLVSLGLLKEKKINILPAYKEPVKEETPAEAQAPEAPATEGGAGGAVEASSEAPVETPAEGVQTEETPAA